jgi:N-methylhydantoinase B/oxoprolinase/acetone carboxylase alpha subunit
MICYGSTRRVESLPHKALAEVEAGEAIEIVTPTGGGWGGCNSPLLAGEG